LSATEVELFRSDDYVPDERAAWWVIDNEDRIEAIGGEILFRPQRDRPTYRNTIEEVV